MVGEMVQNSQSLYSFTFNAKFLFKKYIYSHLTTYFSDIKYLGRTTLPDRETSGLVTEYNARFVQFDESCRIHCPCKRRIFPSISFSTALLILTKGRTCWRATIRYSSLIWMFSFTPTSAVFHSSSHSSRRSKAAEKRSCQCNTCVWVLWSTTSTPLDLPSSAIFAFRKERELGANDAKRGCAENVEWILHPNQYFDRECERI